jgi:hypothetical protein
LRARVTSLACRSAQSTLLDDAEADVPDDGRIPCQSKTDLTVKELSPA